MTKRLFIIACIGLLTFPNTLLAWSRDGHHIVAEVAFQLLSPGAKEKLKAALGNTSLDDAATWM